MNLSRKPAGSKTHLNNATRNRGGSYASALNNQSGNRPLYSAHFSLGKSVEESSKTKVLRPFVPRPSNEYSKITSSSQSRILNKKLETAEEKKNRLKSQLNRFESPFKWRPRQDKPVNEPEIIINRMQEKDREVKDERKFKWRNFIFHLVISYELWRAKKLSEAFEEVCALESVLLIPSNRSDYMFLCIEDALRHVVTASKAFLLLEQDMMTETEQLMEKILPCHMMRRQNQAGIHGIKAAMFMEYGHMGNKKALQEAMEAVKLDRTSAEWHFFVSKCMGRIRRVAQCHELVHPEEVRALNTAIKFDQTNATYQVFLAQVLSERAFREYKKHHPEKKSELYIKIMRTNKAAMHLFKKAVELSPNSPHILIRCARGLMKLPPRLKDLKFTKECIEKALELAPNNPMVHHVQGMYHERFDCDTELPLQAYEKAASLSNFGAAMDLVRLHHKLKIGDIVEELERLSTQVEQIDKLQVIYAQAGSYLLFIKKDIIGALKYYLKVIEINPKSYAMMSHKPIFLRVRDPVNMFDVMLEELATKTDRESFPPEDRQVLKAFIVNTTEHRPLPNEKKKRPTVEEILEMSREVIASDDLYKERRAARRKININKPKRLGKKWHGKKKVVVKNIKVKINGNEKLRPEEEIIRHKREDTIVSSKRRDSVSSVSTVDSDYNRDSTLFGPRGFFLQGSNESLYSRESERFGPHKQEYSLDLTRESNVPGRCHGHSGRASRDSSISSTSSVYSSVDFDSSQGTNMMYPPSNVESQLTVENMKKYNIENSYDIGIRRLSMLSLSSSSSVSQASSSNSLSVMDRVKQSYAMLDRNVKPTLGKKNNFKKHGSTQSLNTHHMADWKKDLENKNIARSGSSQSLNVLEKNLDSKFSKSFKSKFGSRDSSIESTRSFSFMPDFARKDSQNDVEK